MVHFSFIEGFSASNIIWDAVEYTEYGLPLCENLESRMGNIQALMWALK